MHDCTLALPTRNGHAYALDAMRSLHSLHHAGRPGHAGFYAFETMFLSMPHDWRPQGEGRLCVPETDASNRSQESVCLQPGSMQQPTLSLPLSWP